MAIVGVNPKHLPSKRKKKKRKKKKRKKKKTKKKKRKKKKTKKKKKKKNGRDARGALTFLWCRAMRRRAKGCERSTHIPMVPSNEPSCKGIGPP